MITQCMVEESAPDGDGNNTQTIGYIKVYKRRYFILCLFCLYSMINSFQWIQYASINDTFSSYYGVPASWINWTSIIFMLVYIPLIVPASWLLDLIGLRNCIIIGSAGTTLGACVKIFSLGRDGFYITMIGQTIVAVSQLYIISVPPALASVWFPDNQVSIATALGVFGNQLGIGLGFIIPQALISDHTDMDSIRAGLQRLFYSVSVSSGILTLLIVIFFQESPPKTPGMARLQQINESRRLQQDKINPSEISRNAQQRRSYKRTLIKLFKDKNFMYLFASYGINGGVFYAMSTILSQILTPNFHDQSIIGKVGLIITVSGMIGSIMCGYAMDRSHAYKTVSILIYTSTLVSFIAIGYAIKTQQIITLYCAAASLGFFQTGYLPIGFEFATEITFPISENTSAGLLNMSTQVTH